MYAPNVTEITPSERDIVRVQDELLSIRQSDQLSPNVYDEDYMIVNASASNPARGMMAA